MSRAALIDWLYDYARELRQQARPGLYLGTVHSAKGLEFRHVALLDGGWQQRPEQLEEERRLYYVGMTRARETLTLAAFRPGNPLSRALAGEVQERDFAGRHDPQLATRYRTLGLQEIDLGFAGRHPAQAPIHQAIAELQPGDPLQLRADGERHLLLDGRGRCVGRTSRAFHLDLEIEHCEVAGILTRYAEDGEEQFRDGLRCAQWEIVVPRLRGRERSA